MNNDSFSYSLAGLSHSKGGRAINWWQASSSGSGRRPGRARLPYALHMRPRVAESCRDRALVSDILLHRHYLKRRTTPLMVLVLLGQPWGKDAAAVAMVAMLPTNLGALLPALRLHFRRNSLPSVAAGVPTISGQTPRLT